MSQSEGGIIALLCVLAAVYFLPAIIAFSRGHHNSGAILALDLLLGWTALGWIVAFVWSLTATRVGERPAAPPADRPPAWSVLLVAALLAGTLVLVLVAV
jgi:hypothetical protein